MMIRGVTLSCDYFICLYRFILDMGGFPRTLPYLSLPFILFLSTFDIINRFTFRKTDQRFDRNHLTYMSFWIKD